MTRLLTILLLLPAMIMAQNNSEAVSMQETHQFAGATEYHTYQRAEIISEIAYHNPHTVSVRTATDSLTFTFGKSVVYSDQISVPVVAYGEHKTVLILPK